MDLLVCEQVSKHFGGLKAVDQVNLKLIEGEIMGLIGPNGAGKTTLFNMISGFLRSNSGSIRYQNIDIGRLSPHVIARHGLVRTFQHINLFPELSVLDNVIIGRHIHIKSGFLKSLMQSPIKRGEERLAREKAFHILKNIGLSGLESQQVKNLPFGGLQRILGIAVALAAEPKLLLLDEPASGMNTEEKKQIIEIIKNIYNSGVTILIVEHDMNVVMSLCNRILVLDSGKVIAQGTPEQIQSDDRVIEIYLGKGYRDVTSTH
jgi:branched-chain amino acid transport system ATP-binding protein